jgi:DNA-binding LacI/PurR family transcriptional regulator
MYLSDGYKIVSQKISLVDIAKVAGVHRSTVSLALRNSTRISEEQRRNIQKIAEKMGYRMNPLVAALMKSRRTRTEIKSVALAYVTCYPTRWGWRAPHVDRPDYFPGASARAAELGYTLDHFWLSEPGMTTARVCDILRARSINGVLIGRLPPGLHSIDLVWERFSCVALGRTLHTPQLNRLTEDHFASALLAVERMRARGYRKIGFVFSEPDDSPGVGDRWIGGYTRTQEQFPAADRIPCLLHNEAVDAFSAFKQWVRRWSPEAVLVTQAQPVFTWLERLGLNVPRDLGVATLVNDHLENRWSGIHSDAGQMGALATEMLVGMMHRCEVGVPDAPHEVLLPGRWVDGQTLR